MLNQVLKNAFRKISIFTSFSVVFSIIITSQAVAVLNSANSGNSKSNDVTRIYDENYTCSHLVYDYGVTISAQTHCGFSKYNGNVITMATQCVNYARKIGQDSEIENVLLTGVEDFNGLMENSDNKKGVCDSVLMNYSEFVSQ